MSFCREKPGTTAGIGNMLEAGSAKIDGHMQSGFLSCMFTYLFLFSLALKTY